MICDAISHKNAQEPTKSKQEKVVFQFLFENESFCVFEKTLK